MTSSTEYQGRFLKKYFRLSMPMRSIAGQIAIQYHLHYSCITNFKNMAGFIRSFGYDPFDNLTKKYGNFWYKLRAGRALTQTNTCLYFLNSVGMLTAKLLNHSLWHLIDQTVDINKSVSRLPRPLKQQLLLPRNKKELIEYHSLQNFKRSYPSGRECLYNLQSHDSFSALLLTSLMQITELKHCRPSSAEKIAYAQFLYLFGYKYRTLKKQEMGHRINQLLSSNKIIAEESDESISSLKDFEQVEEFLKVGIENKELDLDKYMSEKIKEFITGQPQHPCFTIY